MWKCLRQLIYNHSHDVINVAMYPYLCFVGILRHVEYLLEFKNIILKICKTSKLGEN